VGFEKDSINGNTPKTNCGQYVILFMRGYVTTSDKEAAPRAMLERWEVTVYQK